MADSPTPTVLLGLQRAVLVRSLAERTDGELLDLFLAQKSDAAFEALVRRYGPLVFGICRRILHHAHDAEDAFQATFIVLMRKAPSIVKRDALAAWPFLSWRVAVSSSASRRSRGIIFCAWFMPAVQSHPPCQMLERAS